MLVLRSILLLAICLFLTPFAEAKKGRKNAGLDKHMYFGDCRLTRDPIAGDGPSDLWLISCIRARVGSEISFASGYPDRNFSVNYGEGYGGFHLNQYLSFHGRGIVRDVRPIGDEVFENKNRYTDYAVVRLGNPALHRYRLSTGRMRIPFGIDKSVATESIKVYENPIFWDSPDYGAMISLDDLASAQIDIGAASSDYFGCFEEEIKKKQEEEGVEEEPLEAASMRVSYDIAALDGFRMVASGYAETRGVRRFGLGFVTIGRKKDMTQFEFVRRRSTPTGTAEPFQQIIRLSHISPFRRGNRWLLQIDDERFKHRIGTLGYDTLMWNHANLRFAISYLKSETGDNVKIWNISTGLELIL